MVNLDSDPGSTVSLKSDGSEYGRRHGGNHGQRPTSGDGQREGLVNGWSEMFAICA
jgi:hypothetical protein